MGILKQRILAGENKPVVIKDCVRLVDDEVASKKGVTGMLITGGYKTFVAIKPSIMSTSIAFLLEDFATVLDRFYEQYLQEQPDKKMSFDTWLTARDSELAEKLLMVTDNIMNRSSKTVIRKVYNGLRKIAVKNVAQAVPGIGKLAMIYIK